MASLRKIIADALSVPYDPGNPKYFGLAVWHNAPKLEDSWIKVSKDLDTGDAFIDILDKKGTGKGNVSDIVNLKKKFNLIRRHLPPDDYGINADHPIKAALYQREWLGEDGFRLSGEKSAAQVLNKKTGQYEHVRFNTMRMTVPDQFTTRDITQPEYLRRQQLLYGEDLKSFRRKLYQQGKAGKRTLDIMHLNRPGVEDDLRGATNTGKVKSSFPSEPGKQLHHGNPVGNTASIYKGASQAELNRLWKLQNKLGVPLGNDIRNLFEFDEDLHQKGKRVGIQDIHEWERAAGLDQDYMLDKKGKPIVNPTIKQREEALHKLADDWHNKRKPEIMRRQFQESIIGNDTYTSVKGQRYDRQGKFEKAVVGYKDVHTPIDERLSLTTEQAEARAAARRVKGETLYKARVDNPGFFNTPARPGHDEAVMMQQAKAVDDNALVTGVKRDKAGINQAVGGPLGGEPVRLMNRTSKSLKPKNVITKPRGLNPVGAAGTALAFGQGAQNLAQGNYIKAGARFVEGVTDIIPQTRRLSIAIGAGLDRL